MKIQRTSVFNSNPTNAPVDDLKLSFKTREVAKKLKEQLSAHDIEVNMVRTPDSPHTFDIVT
ncbi:hypothetical protein ACFL6L_02325 [candidate division KSB1 bacterium]